jgi:hypothetical protein
MSKIEEVMNPMKDLKRLVTVLVVVGLLSLAFPRSAHAYLDPGTGSLIIQVIVAAFLGAAFAVKVYWRNIKAFVANRFSKEAQGDQEEDDD